jgi:hypothetical protein
MPVLLVIAAVQLLCGRPAAFSPLRRPRAALNRNGQQAGGACSVKVPPPMNNHQRLADLFQQGQAHRTPVDPALTSAGVYLAPQDQVYAIAFRPLVPGPLILNCTRLSGGRCPPPGPPRRRQTNEAGASPQQTGANNDGLPHRLQSAR